jgi:hypothetical protein
MHNRLYSCLSLFLFIIFPLSFFLPEPSLPSTSAPPLLRSDHPRSRSGPPKVGSGSWLPLLGLAATTNIGNTRRSASSTESLVRRPGLVVFAGSPCLEDARHGEDLVWMLAEAAVAEMHNWLCSCISLFPFVHFPLSFFLLEPSPPPPLLLHCLDPATLGPDLGLPRSDPGRGHPSQALLARPTLGTLGGRPPSRNLRSSTQFWSFPLEVLASRRGLAH